MAKEKPRCICCGKEVGLFDRNAILFYRTTQVVCTDCLERYQKAQGEERDALDRRMLSSALLDDRAEALRNYEEVQARRRQAEEKRLEEEKLLQERAERQREVLRCCGRDMDALGVSTFQLGEYGFFIGHLDNLGSGSLELAIYRCPCCGQMKFFDPELIRK